MPISIGEQSLNLDDLLSMVTDFDILYHYFGEVRFNEAVNSPLREDIHPSFAFYVSECRVRYIDFSTGERGGIFDLLESFWGKSFNEVLHKIWNDLPDFSHTEKVHNIIGRKNGSNYSSSPSLLECRIREWRDYDLEYWNSYGISLKWLKWAEVYPISHKIIFKDNNRYVFAADKYAYAYVEHKEGKVTLKIYQPFNKNGFKWSNKHDRSVVSLWTKIPEYGDKVCICSSLKDALCLSANTGIPALSVQGEGYGMSNTAISELKRRYKEVFIALDGDKAGVEDSIKLQKETAFKIIDCPLIDKAKDWSDIYHFYGKEVLLKEFKKALENAH